MQHALQASAEDVLTAERAWARDWLFKAALPLWWEKGADHKAGGWFDKLDQAGQPVDLPKRLRVQARQAIAFAEAGRLGWEGPWEDACRHAIDYMLERYRRSDGLFRCSVTCDGAPADEAADLYDQAFVLCAFAAGYRELGQPATWRLEAEALLCRLHDVLGHPERGFEEGSPRVLPLRSNPHMHMLEALLAWIEAGAGEPFESDAREIVRLACERLIDPATGAIGEYYDEHWRFHVDGGHLREPGHQFEWAYLLYTAEKTLGGDQAYLCGRLHAFGTEHGVRDGRVIFSVVADGAPVDESSRLWAQTERLRTMLVLAPAMDKPDEAKSIAAAAESVATLRRFLDVPERGLWLDRIASDGAFVDEPAPASSLYHIVNGMAPLIGRKASPGSASAGSRWRCA